MAKELGACLTVQVDHKAASDLKPVNVSGAAHAVEHCKSLIFALFDSNNQTGNVPSGGGGGMQGYMGGAGGGGGGGGGGEITRTLECPAGIVGRIIGRGGETIRSLQTGSGAHITIDQVR